jgi:hypothetical protein
VLRASNRSLDDQQLISFVSGDVEEGVVGRLVPTASGVATG